MIQLALDMGYTKYLEEVVTDDGIGHNIFEPIQIEVDLETGIAYTREPGAPIDTDELSPWEDEEFESITRSQLSFSQFITSVRHERERQDAKFPEQVNADFPDSGSRFALIGKFETMARNAYEAAATAGELTWSHILDEEVAEALAAAAKGDIEGVREELVQVAAVACKWWQALERRGSK